MKTYLVSILIALSTQILPAQLPVDTDVTPDYFQYRAGHLYWYLNEVERPIKESVRFKNGMIVNPDGTYKKLNKKPMQLLSGEFLDIDGKVFKTKTELDVQLNRHREAVNQEYLLFQNGEIIHVKNGLRTILEENITLSNGTILHPNGLCKLKTGTMLNLHEGECLDMHGKKYSDAWTFHLKMEQITAAQKE